MAARYTTETFFRPDEADRKPWTVPAFIYNRCRLLLSRSQTGSVFVPIRSMQYLAVVDDEEVIFVDSLGGHMVHGNEGGRPILIAWQPRSRERQGLNDSVPCEVVYYRAGLAELQTRLASEFGRALDQLEERYGHAAVPVKGARVIPLRGGNPL